MTEENNKFKVGDFCFCEFRLKKITEMRGEYVFGVSDGYFNTGGNLTNRCFPISFEVIEHSKLASNYYDTIHKIPINGLNSPDIHSIITEMWAELCRTNSKDVSTKLINFCNAVIEEATKCSELTVNGIKLFREYRG